MKRGGPSHPKTLALAALLGVDRWGAVGILESLFHWAGQYARRGDLGRYPPAAIAAGIGWLGEPDKLLAALVTSRWVDECTCHGLKIHDWPDHADQAIYKTKEVLTQGFLRCYKDGRRIDGRYPKDIRPHPSAGTGNKAQGTGSKADGTGHRDSVGEAAVAYWESRGGVVRSPTVRRSYVERASARAKDGATLDDLKACVDHAATDEFYLSKKYFSDPAVFWRNAERVEKLSTAMRSKSQPLPILQGQPPARPRSLDRDDVAATTEQIKAALARTGTES